MRLTAALQYIVALPVGFALQNAIRSDERLPSGRQSPNCSLGATLLFTDAKARCRRRDDIAALVLADAQDPVDNGATVLQQYISSTVADEIACSDR